LLDEARAFWSNWAERCRYAGPYRDQVVRSALVLKGLTNAPTGAFVAAPTTSLPEVIGGERNWDYRFTWLRDSALALNALFMLGFREEAHEFMGWIRRTAAGRAADLQSMYGIGGERMLTEVELDWVEGYRASRPVRIGNRAVGQLQLDTYGELLDTAWLYHRHGGEIDRRLWTFLAGVVDVVEERWEQPDEGIWEVRSARQHWVSSKLFCWVAVDRAIRLAEDLELPADLVRWRALRRRIRRLILTRGVDDRTGAFKRCLDSNEADAAALLVPLVKFLSPDDPRVRATIARVEKELTSDGLVYRHRTEDGFAGKEGAFLICSFWLVDNLALVGRDAEARDLFERLLTYGNDLGLLSEEADPETGQLLGNFPQAFSHLGLIGAAIHLDHAGAG
jgi:GH15 family glucan-1,4-alpha-glucosidase